MKIVLTRSMLPGDVAYIRAGLDREIEGQYELVIPEDYSEQELCRLVKDADVLLGPFVTPAILDSAKTAKLVQVPWTGMDTFDFDAVKGRGVTVCNTHSNADAVAELATALILDLVKKVSYHDRKMRAGSWNRDQKPLGLKSQMISNMAACLLGFGSIGSRIGRLLSVFGAKVIAVDDYAGDKGVANAVYPTAATIDAVSVADIVVCTVPLTEKTKGMIGTELLAHMQKGALLINMSRASLVEEDALWDALQNEHIGGYAADVWWSTPKRGESESWPSSKHPFQELDNVVMSPHRAGFIDGALPHLDGAIENIIALTNGGDLSCEVDINKGF